VRKKPTNHRFNEEAFHHGSLSIAVAPALEVQKEIAALDEERRIWEFGVKQWADVLVKSTSEEKESLAPRLEDKKARLLIARNKLQDHRKNLGVKHRAWSYQLIKDAPPQIFALRKEFVERIEAFRDTIYATTDFAVKKSLFIQYQEIMEIARRSSELSDAYITACALTDTERAPDVRSGQQIFLGTGEFSGISRAIRLHAGAGNSSRKG
jgi:hypothetical protein